MNSKLRSYTRVAGIPVGLTSGNTSVSEIDTFTGLIIDECVTIARSNCYLSKEALIEYIKLEFGIGK